MADSNRKGAFSISDVRQRSLDGFWENLRSNAQYAWFVGGTATPTTVTRADLANDSIATSARGNLTNGHDNNATVGNNNSAWAAGGTNASAVDRIIFASDTAATVARGFLPVATPAPHPLGNGLTYGWVVGGGPLPSFISSLLRIEFASDSATAASRGTLNFARLQGAHFSTQFYGWIAAGYTTGTTPFSAIERIDFSNDLTSPAIRGNLVQTKQGLGGSSNTDNYGYILGATQTPGPYVSYIERVDLSNDTGITLLRGFATANKTNPGGTGNASFGWYGSGFNGTTNLSTVDRLDYSSDTGSAVSRGSLPAITNFVREVVGIGGYPQYPGNVSTTTAVVTVATLGFGWVLGGATPGLVSTVERVDFSNDTANASIRGPLTAARRQITNVGNASYGYNVGGNTPGSSITDRLDFSNDLTATMQTLTALAAARYAGAGFSNASFGWINGGSGYSQLDRLDFANDNYNLVTRANMPATRQRHASTNTPNYGWVAGGKATPSITITSAVIRSDLPSDTLTLSSRGALSAARYDLGSTGNKLYGWYAGGSGPFPTTYSTIDRIDYASDSTTALARGPLTGTSQPNGTGNEFYGWFMANGTSIYQRIDYANDGVTAVARGALSGSKYMKGTISNYVMDVRQTYFGAPLNGSSAWHFGGIASYPTYLSTINRIDFSNDSLTAGVRGNNIVARAGMANVGNQFYGWSLLGDRATPPPSSLIERLDFSNDLAGGVSRGDSGPVYGSVTSVSGASNSQYGWIMGGQPSVSLITRMEFANDTAYAHRRNVLNTIRIILGTSNTVDYGYAVAGTAGGGVPGLLSSVDRLTFNNDTAAVLARGVMAAARYGLTGTGNTNYGWFSGGKNPASISTIDRIDYANDSAAASNRGNLLIANGNAKATGNAFYQWISGGGGFPLYSSVHRLDYSNDTTVVARGSLAAARYSHGGFSNYIVSNPQPYITLYNIGSAKFGTTGASSYGWYGAGAAPETSLVERLTWDNDTTSLSTRGTLAIARKALGSSNNTNYGWYTSGQQPAGGFYTIIDRIDYSNDAVTASTRGSIAAGRYANSTNGNASYGWIVGGVVAGPTYISTVERINYASDAITTIVRGPISTLRTRAASVANSNFGWWSGGYSGTAPAGISSTDRVDFANDLNISLAKNVTSVAASQRWGVGNLSYGWLGGGQISAVTVTTVDRIDYANDTRAILTRGPLTLARQRLAAAGNAYYGWFGGGLQGPGVRIGTVDRLDYASDSAAAISRTNITIRDQLAATSDYIK